MRTQAIRAAALASALLLAACGSSTPAASPAANGTTPAANPTSAAAQSGAQPSTAAGQPTAGSGGTLPTGDPCALVTAAEMKTVTGLTLKPEYVAASGECHMQWPDKNGSISIAFSDHGLAFFSANLPKGAANPVAGHAGWWDGESGVETLFVEVPGGVLKVQVQDVGGVLKTGDSKTIAGKVAETVLAKLK